MKATRLKLPTSWCRDVLAGLHAEAVATGGRVLCELRREPLETDGSNAKTSGQFEILFCVVPPIIAEGIRRLTHPEEFAQKREGKAK